MKTRIALYIALGLVSASAAVAGNIGFDGAWKEQRFSLLSSNDYSFSGDVLGVSSDSTVSLVWRALPQSLWHGRSAAWNWSVEESVPPTDLTRKGGDDRNLSLYFVFLPMQAAEAAQGSGIRSLLDKPKARVLVYVWGGAHDRGDVLPSPYLGARGKTVVLRAAGTGSQSESVDLARDHQRAFGSEPESLVGVAVSADSDDTDSQISGRISGLAVQ